MKQDNPCGLDGFAFLEFSGPNPKALHQQFNNMGFTPTAKHQSLDITRYQQGKIQFFVNAADHCQAAKHAMVHGPGACAMGFKVAHAKAAYDHCLAQGAKAFVDDSEANHGLLAIEAIGGSVIYFVDDQHEAFAGHWKDLAATTPPSIGLVALDHLTHNVLRGNMDKWAHFYESLFNFHEIRYFDIEGQLTGLISRALASPCGNIKIPLNESKDDASQIEEFLHEYQGEGIQHIALTTHNIYQTVPALKEEGIRFLDVPDTYYDMLNQRLPWHTEPLQQLQDQKILMDGESTPQAGLLLQIFTQNTFGPVFFEIIQRKGNQGFGEGNFQALFEAIERDQIKRGTLS